MRLALLGHHQARTLGQAAGVMLDAEIQVLDTPPDTGAFDLVLAQPSHVDEALRQRFGDRLVTIAAFECRALFPDACRLAASTPLHSVLVLDAFLSGLSEADAAHCFDLANLQRLGLLEPWSASFTRLRAREQDAAIDMPCAAIMEEACRRYAAFVSLDRPTAPFLADYLAAVFRQLGLAYADINPLALPEPTSELVTTPVLDEIAEHHRLPYRTAQLWTTATGARLTRPDYIAGAYRQYRDTPRDQLLVSAPIDLQAYLATEPSLAHLVRATPSLPPERHTSPDEPAKQIRATNRALVEAGRYAGRVEAYTGRIDPAVEELTQQVNKLRASMELTRQAIITSAPRRTWRFVSRMAALSALLLLVTETVLLFHALR